MKLVVVPVTLGTNALIYRHAKTLQLPTEDQCSEIRFQRLSNHISKHLERREFKSSEKLSTVYLVPNTLHPQRPS